MKRLTTFFLTFLAVLSFSTALLAMPVVGDPADASSAADAFKIDNGSVPNVGASDYLKGDIQHEYSCIHTAPSGVGISDDEWNSKFASRFIYCMKDIMRKGTVDMIGDVWLYAGPTMAAAFILSLAIFGMNMVGGQLRDVKQETAILFVRIFFVLTFGYLFSTHDRIDGLVGFFYGVTEDLLALVANASRETFSQATAGSGTLSNVLLSCNAAAHNTMPEWFNVFDRVDCLFNGMIGFGKATAMRLGIIGILGAALFSGTVGFGIVSAGITFIVTFTLFVARCCFSILMTFGTLSLLLIILPVVLPLLMFKTTETYVTDRWLPMAVSSFVQSAIVVAFLFFGIKLLETILYVGTPGVYVDPFDSTALPQYLTAGDNPPPNYMPAVTPIFNILGVDKSASEEKQAEQMQNNFAYSRLIDWNINFESAINTWNENNCGKHGQVELAQNNTALNADPDDPAYSTMSSNAAIRKQAFQESQLVLEHNPTNPLEAAKRVWQNATRLVECGTGRLVNGLGIANWGSNVLNTTLNGLTPKVHLLDLTKNMPLDNYVLMADGTYKPVPAASIDDKSRLQALRLRMLLTSLLALLTITVVLAQFMTIIPQLASTITGGMRGGAVMPMAPSKIVNSVSAIMHNAESYARENNQKGLLTGGGIKGALGGITSPFKALGAGVTRSAGQLYSKTADPNYFRKKVVKREIKKGARDDRK